MNIKERILESINKQNKRREGIHVTSLVYGCLRRSYYEQTVGDGLFNLKTLLTFWIGRAIHMTPLLKEHELQLEFEGIVGTVDDFEPEEGLLIDKKTCKLIPKEAYSHHKKQIEYYIWLLKKNGHDVKKAYVLYIDIVNKKLELFPVFARNLDVIEKEILERKNMLLEALNNKEMPPRSMSWLCDYCSFSGRCFNAQ